MGRCTYSLSTCTCTCTPLSLSSFLSRCFSSCYVKTPIITSDHNFQTCSGPLYLNPTALSSTLPPPQSHKREKEKKTNTPSPNSVARTPKIHPLRQIPHHLHLPLPFPSLFLLHHNHPLINAPPKRRSPLHPPKFKLKLRRGGRRGRSLGR
ncbi:hypothetical protein DL95DRAFT_9974 [Leptodontidium sp. 2 PMI_412]|nr:hypothetical protein DL95DRAFT_9974 [Leptodontidium sp. 2 PMI_412]